MVYLSMFHSMNSVFFNCKRPWAKSVVLAKCSASPKFHLKVVSQHHFNERGYALIWRHIGKHFKWAMSCNCLMSFTLHNPIIKLEDAIFLIFLCPRQLFLIQSRDKLSNDLKRNIKTKKATTNNFYNL